jgi:hypothetical protein
MAVGGKISERFDLSLVPESEALWDKIDGKLAWQRCIEINDLRLKNWGVARAATKVMDQDDEIPM